MPVIGHALVGIVIAQQYGSAAAARTRWSRLVWFPAIVGLSYLPDVLTQTGVWLRLPPAQAAGHSMPVACGLGALLGLLWSRLAGASRRRAIALAVGVLLMHDALDLLQDAERMPLWPFSRWQLGADWLMFSQRVAAEAVAFGIPFVGYQVWRAATRRPLLGDGPTSPALRWTAGLFTCTVLAATVGVSYLREERGRQMERAEELFREGQLHEALVAIDAAERWPSPAGRGDLLRGQVYAGIGRDDEAESFLRRAHRNDPDAFWPTAALAEFYASRGPAETRRRRSAPYTEALRARFAGHDVFHRVMERIERHLNAGQ